MSLAASSPPSTGQGRESSISKVTWRCSASIREMATTLLTTDTKSAGRSVSRAGLA